MSKSFNKALDFSYNGNIIINTSGSLSARGSVNTLGSIVMSSNNMTIGSNVIVTGPVLQIPSGNIAARPGVPQNGSIRYNTETQQFEGYGPGGAWGSLGGVVDIAQTTRILASATPSTTDGNLYFFTTGTERMRINSVGNVGIGTTAPTFNLDVNGIARVSNGITTGNLEVVGLTDTLNFTATNASVSNVWATTISGSNLSLSGNINVGGTLTVVNITTTNLMDTNLTAGIARITTNLVAVGSINTIGNIFTTGGNVGIGTTNPLFNLDVSGTTRVSTSLTTGALFSTNLTSTNIVATSISSGNLNLSSGLTSSSIQVTNETVTTSTIATLLNTNLGSTNISSATLNLSNGVTSGSAQITNLNATTSTIATLLNTNLGSTNISSATLTLSTGVTSGSAQITNLNATTSTIATLLNTNLGSTNISSATLNLSIGITSNSAQITNSNVTTQTIGTSRITSNLLALGNANTLGNIFTTGGNVGIGTTAPQSFSQLHIRSSSSNSGSYIALDATNGANGRLYAIGSTLSGNSAGAGALEFFDLTSGVMRMIIGSSGNLGINTANPGDLFTISSGNIVISSDNATSRGFMINQNSVWGGVDSEGSITTGSQIINIGANMNRSKTWNSTYNGGWLRIDTRGGTLPLFQWYSKLNTSGTETVVMSLTTQGNLALTGLIASNISTSNLSVTTFNPANISTTNITTSTLNVSSLSMENVLINAFEASTGGSKGVFFRTGFTSSSLNYNLSILTYDHNGDNFSDGLSINSFDGLSFCTGSNTRQERMRLTSAGNLGIGTTTPAFPLDVTGSARFTGGVTVGNLEVVGLTDTVNLTVTNISSSNVRSTFATIASLQLTGISGTLTLGSPSSIFSHSCFLGNSYGYLELWVTSTSGEYSTSSLAGDIVMRSNKNMILQAAGGISGAHIYIATSGNVGIGVTSPSYALHVNGDVVATGDMISFASLSDQRLKTNIESLDTDNSLETIRNLRPVTFNWKEDIFNEEKRSQEDVGFIAQEVESIIPYAVSDYKYSEMIYKSMKHERIIPYLVGAIQRLDTKISELEYENKWLKMEIENLKNKEY